MDPKPSSNRYSLDSSTNSSTVSRPQEAEDQTAESGFGEGPSFQVSVSEQVDGPGENYTAHGGTSGSQIHVPRHFGTSLALQTAAESAFGAGREGPSFQVSKQVVGPVENDTAHGSTIGSQIYIPQRVGTSFDVFKPDRVEGNGRFSSLFDDGSNTLIPPPHTMGRYPIPVERENETELYSEECQEYERIIKKAAAASKNHESARLTKYLTDVNKKLDSKLYEKEKLLKKFERRIKDLQLQAHLKGIEIESLRQQMAETEQENDDCQFKIKRLEKEVEWLKYQSDEEERKKHSFELPRGDSPRDLLARVEQQLETLQRRIQELEDENTRKDAEISRLQTQNAVTEAEAIKLEKEKTSVIIKEKDDQLEVLVESLYQLIIEKGFGQQYLHVQMSQKSEHYAHFFKERAESVAALHLEAPRSSLSAVSVQFHTKRRKPESISTPIGADPILFEVGGRDLSSPFDNAHLSIASELDGIQESSTKRSSGLAVNSYSMEIPSHDLVYLASFFDCVDFLVDLLELTPAEKSDAMKKDNTSAQKAVLYCLSCWKKREPEKATFQALLDIVRKLKRGDIVRNIEGYFHKYYLNVTACMT